MRRGLIAATVLVAGCASAGPPPGGPEDRTPPRLVRVTPDTNAVNVRDKVATFYFDEVINDRGEGPNDIGSFFLVSPSDGTPRVSWHRSRIDVRPRHGFRPNTAYTITLLPGLSDLRANAMKTGATLVFATGATIPTLRITGTAFDWVAERPAPRALIEAITPDSVVYLAQADSLGKFAVGPLNPGTYLVRAILDQNQNHTLDRGESWDSVRVTAPQTAPAELLAASRDTMPALLQSVTTVDSVTLRFTFDRLLDPTQSFPSANFRVAGSDSVAIPITATRTPREEVEAGKTRETAATDSARRADSLAGRPVTPPPTAVPPLPATRNAPAPPAKPSRPAPFTAITVVLGRPLPPNTNFVARVSSVRALSGRVLGSEKRFSTPKPPPPPKTPADSAGARPAAPRQGAPGAVTPGGAAPPTAPPATPPSRP